MARRLILDSIVPSDFGHYGPEGQVFRFGGRGPVAVVGPNGAGKSTGVPIALTWCLYGKGPPVRMGASTAAVKGKQVARDGEAARVAVFLRAEGDPRFHGYQIARERPKKGGDVLRVRGYVTPHPDSDVVDLGGEQATVDALVGASYEVFTRTVVHGQNDPWCFAEATDARKREILDAISGAELLGIPYERAKGWRDRAAQAAAASAQRATDAERRALACDVSEAERKAADWDASAAARLAQVEQDAEGARQALAEAERYDAEAEQRRVARAAVEARRPSVDLRPYETALQGATVAHRAAASQFAAAQALVHQVEHAVKLGQPCPTCGQVVGPDAPVAARHDELADNLRPLDEARGVAERYEGECRTSRDQTVAWLQHAEAQWRNELAAYPDPGPPRAPAARRAADAQAARVNDMRKAENPHREAIRKVAETRAGLEREATNLREQERGTKHEAAVWEAWCEVLAPKGVRAHLAEGALSAIETEACRWLDVLSGGRMQVRFSPTTTGAKGAAREEIATVVLSREGGAFEERDLVTYSGGEKRRINFAVDLGVAAVFARGGALPLSLLVLDEEVLSGMDHEGKRAVVVALHHAGVADVVVVEHDDATVGLFEHRIEVARDATNGYSVAREV